MRTIREMLGSNETVWVYLESREIWERFVGMAAEEGFHFGDLPREKWDFSHAVAVHSSGESGHLPLFVWCMSFGRNGHDCPEKIDFAKYIRGESDHECQSSHFSGRLFYT